MQVYLDFEKPVAELETKIQELRRLSEEGADIAPEVEQLQGKIHEALKDTYGRLSAWQKTQVARHQDRPHFGDYVARLAEDFVPLAGDRTFAEDPAMQVGMGRIGRRSVMLIGHEKGRGTEGRVKHNFGMARPEGYRKAIRGMKLAERFGLPVITLIDTAGAYPGPDSEERGIAQAIAASLDCCLGLGVPLIAMIVGEGGSGGAVALAAADRVVMLEHAVYSVITPEGCAAILWKDQDKAKDAAEALRLTAQHLSDLGVIDEIVPEPLGGAHRDPLATIDAAGTVLRRHLDALAGQAPDKLINDRRRKFLEMGTNL
ncbi:acetyl-CoA carboxylase carboxyltransferase subunit alpha [Marinibaculum pumilum]|uniref:Acetyl-coenzyme A carboxylase carboxyl transferase subunit alpha n=1 Tax=Marinibaculum pumilum TaxID=1766165 RepID=A0ABV7KX42_9PROT